MKKTIPAESLELLPPEGDPNVGYAAFSILAEIIEDKESHGLIDKWNRAAELTRNKHWKQKSGQPGLVTANLLFAHRQRTVNMLTDNNPTFNVSRLGGEADEGFSDKVLKLAEFWWGDQEQQSVFEKSVGNGEESGACVEKAIFNPDLEMGGEVEILNVPLFNFGVYPVETTDIRKTDAIVHYYPMSVREAMRKWPDKADKIRGDADVLKEIGDLRREIAGAGFKKGGYNTTYNEGTSSFAMKFPFQFAANTMRKILNMVGGTEQGDKLLMLEIWVKDYTKVPDGEPFEQDDVVVQAYKSKYSGNIRMVQTCNAGQVVLSDRNNPSINPNIPEEKSINSYLYDKFPFSIAQSITDTVSIFGMSDYEQLEQLNIEVDKTMSQLTTFKDKSSRLKVINPKDSGVPNDHFTNMPGILNPVNAMVGQGIRYMENPPIPAELVNVLDIYQNLFFIIAGSFDFEQAKEGGKDVIAYKAIAALIERASTFLKGKIRNYSKLIRERGRMYISLAQNWYTEERWITYDDGGETETMPIVGTDLLFPAKISVVSGSTMPRAKVQEREEAIALSQMGKIDDEELFKRLDWPDRKNLIKRMRQGPIGMFLEKLGEIGMPPALIQIMQGISQMDDKALDREMKEGSIPDMRQVLIGVLSGQQPPNPKLEKAQAEVALINAKIQTEQVNQMVALSGVQLDTESIKQNWVKIAAMIKDQDHKQFIDGVNEGYRYNEGSGGDIKGIKSDNKRLK